MKTKVDFVNPRRLVPSDYNPRIMDPSDMEKLRRSIREIGMVQNIIVQMPGNRIIAGHQRAEAAIAEGLDRVLILRVWCSDTKAKQMNLLLNKSQEWAQWETDKLRTMLTDLQLQGEDIERTGFGREEAERILSAALETSGIERMELKPAPKMVWYLIGIPLDGFAEVQEPIAILEAKAVDGKSGISVQSSRPAA